MKVYIKNIGTTDIIFSFTTLVVNTIYLIYDINDIYMSKSIIDELNIYYTGYANIDDEINNGTIILVNDTNELSKEDSKIKLEYLRSQIYNLDLTNLHKFVFNADNDALLVSSTFGDPLGMTDHWKQIMYTSIPGETCYNDYQITTEIRVAYVGYYIQSPVDPKDYIEMSIIDKDDILGEFAANNLTVNGSDFIQIKKFIYDWHPISKSEEFKGLFQGQIVMSGLYLRLAYTSFGSTPIIMNSILSWYQ